MKPEGHSRTLLAITRSKAKMFEYGLPENEHIEIPRDPARLMRLTVGMLGDLASAVSRNGTDQAHVGELTLSLRFAARFFDAYVGTKLTQSNDAYLLLLASATYYLCDLPGSASVLASRIRPNEIDLQADGLDHLLWWLLQGDLSFKTAPPAESKYRDDIHRVWRGVEAGSWQSPITPFISFR